MYITCKCSAYCFTNKGESIILTCLSILYDCLLAKEEAQNDIDLGLLLYDSFFFEVNCLHKLMSFQYHNQGKAGVRDPTTQ